MGALLLAGCKEEAVPEPPVVRPVKIVTIGGPEGGLTRELPGSIRAAQDAEIGFEVAGRIVELAVREGQQVAAGDELARLDDRDYQAGYDQVRAALRKAQADLDRSLKIYREDPGAISTAKIEADRKAAEVAEAELRKAEKALEDTVLRAPFDGLVARRLVENFQNVQAKEPVFIMQNISHLEIEVAVPERDVASADRQLSIDEVTERVHPRVEISSLPGRSFPARVKERATAADPVTRTFQVRLRFDNPEDTGILPGMTARVVYDVPRGSVIRLPARATFADEQGVPQVWVVAPDTLTVHRTPVELGNLVGDEVEIAGGLKTGDQVAVSGVHQLREGMQVRRYEQ